MEDTTTPLIAYPSAKHRPDKWCHLVNVGWNRGNVEALTQFFLGPDYEPSVFRVKLAEEIPSLGGSDMRGTAFVYMPDFEEEGYCGIASPLLKMNTGNVPEGTIVMRPDGGAGG